MTEADTRRCVTCPRLRQGEPRIYDRQQVCDGCRSRMRGMLQELAENYQLLGLGELVNAGRWVDGGGYRPELGYDVTHTDPVAAYVPVGTVVSRNGQRVSGSRTPPLPLAVTPLDLSMPARVQRVSDDLLPDYEQATVEVKVYTPVPPGTEPVLATVTMTQRRRRRDANGHPMWAPSDDQAGELPVASVLDSWARDWQTYRNENLPPPTVDRLTRWLSDRLDWAADHHPAIDDFAEELAEQCSLVYNAAGLRGPQPADMVGVPCRQCDQMNLYHWPGSDRVECGSCPALMTVEDYHRWAELVSQPGWRRWVSQLAEAHGMPRCEGLWAPPDGAPVIRTTCYLALGHYPPTRHLGEHGEWSYGPNGEVHTRLAGRSA
jgi:hypothetical protein